MSQLIMSWKGFYFIGVSLIVDVLSSSERNNFGVPEKSPRSFIFSNPVYGFLWNQDNDSLIVSSDSFDFHINQNLTLIKRENSQLCTSGPVIRFNCSDQNIKQKHVLASWIFRRNMFVVCKRIPLYECVEDGKFYGHMLTLFHSRESKCSTNETWTNWAISKTKTSQKTFSEPIRNSVIYQTVKRNWKVDDRSKKSQNLSLFLNYQPKSQKYQGLFLISELGNRNYLYSFTNKGFAYVIITDQTVGKTSIVRFCVNEKTRFSYSDIDIGCLDKDQNFLTLASAAYLTKNEKVNKELTLYVIFMKTDEKKMIENSATSVICAYPYAEIEKLFKIYNQHNGDLGLIKSSGVKLVDVNNKVFQGEVKATFAEKGTALAVTTQNNNVVAFVGTSKGYLFEIFLDNNSISSPRYHVSFRDSLRAPEVKPEIISVTFDTKEENLYLLFDKAVVKAAVNLCSFYSYAKACFSSSLLCSWYNDECIPKKSCKGSCKMTWEEYNEPPRISMHGTGSGTLKGGAVLKFNVNFGSTVVRDKSTQVSFNIGNITCKHNNWVELFQSANYTWSLECTTGNSNNEFSGPVVMIISDENKRQIIAQTQTSQIFSYLTPKLYGITPGYGPIAGGTYVTLHGKNMNIGTEQRVSVGNLDCPITKNDGINIICTTSAMKPSIKLLATRDQLLTLRIDEAVFIPEPEDQRLYSFFIYKADPIIYNFHPNSTTYSGGRQLTVFGQNLDSVANPLMKVTVSVNNYIETFNQTCMQADSENLKCPIPSLRTKGLIPKLTLNDSIHAKLSFIMDGVKVENLYGAGKEFTLLYLTDESYSLNTTSNEDTSTELNVKGGDGNLTNEFKSIFIPNDVSESATQNAIICVGLVIGIALLLLAIKWKLVPYIRTRNTRREEETTYEFEELEDLNTSNNSKFQMALDESKEELPPPYQRKFNISQEILEFGTVETPMTDKPYTGESALPRDSIMFRCWIKK